MLNERPNNLIELPELLTQLKWISNLIPDSLTPTLTTLFVETRFIEIIISFESIVMK